MLRVPSGKRWVHSSRGHHYDDRCRIAPGVIRKASENCFSISDLYRVGTEIAEMHADIARSFFKPIIPLLP